MSHHYHRLHVENKPPMAPIARNKGAVEGIHTGASRLSSLEMLAFSWFYDGCSCLQQNLPVQAGCDTAHDHCMVSTYSSC